MAVAHSTTKPVLPKSTEYPNFETQIPTPNIYQNETKQIITNYLCSDCGTEFRDKEKVCEHFIKVHKKKIVFPDTQKTENLAGPSQVSQQNNLQTVCEQCDLPTLKQNLEFHKKTCDGQKDYVFERLGRNLIDLHYSKYPSQYPDKLCCGECGRNFTQRMDLERHILTVHYNIKEYPCLICAKLFTSKQILKRHFKTVHEGIKPFNCNICEYKTTNNSKFNRPFKSVHEGIKPFNCNICKYKTAYNSRLNRHFKSVHEGIKPFNCNICKYKTSNNSQLNRHIKSVHEGIKPFKCNICAYQTAHKKDLKNHIERVHKQIKPFKCHICEFETATNSYLDKHLRSHANHTLKYYKKICPKCRGLFVYINQHIETCKASEISLQNFLNTSTGNLCSKCNIPFCSQESLELHFNCCEGPEIETQKKMRITNVEKKIMIAEQFSCSKCDMDFDLRVALKEHSRNCEIALVQPGEEHFDHTYSKGNSNFNENLLGPNRKLKQIGQASEHSSLESDEMKTEVKKYMLKDFEAHEQVGIDYIASNDFNLPVVKSETIKTEFKVEVKEETCEEFNANEQIGMDFITSKDFDTSIQSSVKTEVKTEVKTGVKAEVKEETCEEFNVNEQIGMDFITSEGFDTSIQSQTEVKMEINPEVKTEFKIEAKTEVKTENFEDFEIREQAVIDFITSKDY